MIVAIATDHAGFSLKETVINQIKAMGHDVLDLGACNCESSDFPDFAAAAAQALAAGKAWRAVLLCGSGVGMAVVANKIKGVRAGVCHDCYSAAQGVQHEEMNALCIGARIVGPSLAEELVKAFLNAKFEGKERQLRRLQKIADIEERNFK